jgi:16S rRNA (guanine966-N2)-methyltransferase
MIRITGGEFRNRRLETPKGMDIRPTREVMRLALFNMFYNRILRCSVLEIFAGTGAVGFEALSRGAGEVTFVDNANQSINLLKTSAAKLDVEAKIHLIRRDWKPALRELGAMGRKFDLIFADPPWKSDLELPVLELVIETGILAEHGWLAVESPGGRKTAFPADLLPIRVDRDYGISRLTVFTREQEEG